MGEKQTKPFQLSFNGSLKVDFQGSHVTSDGGLIRLGGIKKRVFSGLVRELDERLGLGELIDEHLSDSRQGTAVHAQWLICCGSRSTAAWRASRGLNDFGSRTGRTARSRRTD